MKSVRVVMSLLLVLGTLAVAAESDPRKSFDKLKSLAGAWQGKTSDGQPVDVTFRVTSGGSALMSEIMGKEDMISMFHLDGDRLLMIHYCSAGNQPRMKATTSPDGRMLRFDFIDATNLASPEAGHMQRVIFTFPDADHHTEEWFFVQDGKEAGHERFNLERKKPIE
jgi:hypothetical protein